MKVAFLGDIGLIGRYSYSNNDIAKEQFAGVKEYLQKFDLVVGNLEVPLCKNLNKNGVKSAHLNGVPQDVEILEYIGVDVVNLANNHIYDFGEAGLDSTTKYLAKAGIGYFGTGGKNFNYSDLDSHLIFYGYCSYNTNPLGCFSLFGKEKVNSLRYQKIKNNLNDSLKKSCLPVISIHSGTENVSMPSIDDIEFSQRLDEIRQYIYYGHHPHVIQGLATGSTNNSVIAYSLGNFSFDDIPGRHEDDPFLIQTSDNKTGLILEVNIKSNVVESTNHSLVIMNEKSVTVEEDRNSLLEDTSNLLSLRSGDYLQKRRSDIEKITSSRNDKRTIGWYFRRLNFRSLRLVFDICLNRYLYLKSGQGKNILSMSCRSVITKRK